MLEISSTFYSIRFFINIRLIRIFAQLTNSIKLLFIKNIYHTSLKNTLFKSNKETLIITHADKLSQINDDNDLTMAKDLITTQIFRILNKTGFSLNNKNNLLDKNVIKNNFV